MNYPWKRYAHNNSRYSKKPIDFSFNMIFCNEIIVEGQNGVIIPPRNVDSLYAAMKFFIAQKDDLVKKMSANARPMIASRYEQCKVWEALLEEYQCLR